MIKSTFYANLRLHLGPLKQAQVNGFETILDTWDEAQVTDE
jgi:hypothetical protein